MKKTTAAFAAIWVFASVSAAAGEGAAGGIAFDAGADLRIRQEIMDNTPGLPGGGVALPAARGPYRNHVRIRPRVWGEVRQDDEWRLYVRFADEWRWNVRPRNHSNVFPDELIVDNLFFEAKGLFDGLVDSFAVGRQDLYNLFGLDNIFVDGTPGDGSRTLYSDLARIGFDFEDAGRLDLFALYDSDENPLRWGTRRGRHRSLAGLGGGAEADMDDWGWGGVYSGRAGEALPWKVFAMQKRTMAYRRGGAKHPATRRELLGANLRPELGGGFAALLEAMGQVGRNGEGDWLSGWSACAGIEWKEPEDRSIRPFAGLRLHFMSGDKNAADEDGGRRAWDPMWARGVNYSEMFLYGTHYGAAWWSNTVIAKAHGGLDFGPSHKLYFSTAPVFAQADDGLGGGDGHFKGLLSQARYDFPILAADKDEGRSLQITGHVFAELFNPGGYFESDRPGWFLRWQIAFAF